MYQFSLQENKDYAKFKKMNCAKLFHKYRGLFSDMYDSEKYALSPLKLSKKGFDDDTVSEQTGSLEKMPFSAEMRDEHVPSSRPFSMSRMECSGGHSGENRKYRARADKG
ncbi:Uncharacterized protein Adt_22808 [Abeliophyllum distichum]|uniref:Uncharacterized protein n=1 Tax=Abeliophyllum distichum TaxID=126358 RepID=A0ABD1SBQ8_9LAMI